MQHPQLENFFRTHGRDCRLDASNPIDLGNDDAVWLVTEGRIDVFMIKETTTSGPPRSRCYSIFPGETLFGHELPEGIEMTGLAIPGTTALRIERRIIKEHADTTEAAQAIDLFVSRLTSSITGKIENIPDDVSILVPEKSCKMDKGSKSATGNGVLWITPVRGKGLYAGAVSFEQGQGSFPLAGSIWLEAATDIELDVAETSEAIKRPDFDNCLESFMANASELFALNSSLTDADRLTTLRQKEKNDMLMGHSGLLQLASIMNPAPTTQLGNSGDSLSEAVTMVAAHAGLNISPPPMEKSGATVEDYAEKEGFRTRKISLEGKWYRHDCGPLVGFINGGLQPVALIPESAKSYRMHNFKNGKSARVDQKKAKEISPLAYTIYRPLPAKELKLRDIPLFGLHGSWKDLGKMFSLGIVAGLMALLAPILTKTIFNDIIPGAERGRLLQVIAILIGFSISSTLFESAKGIATLRFKNRTDHNLETALWDRLMRMPADFFKNYTAGDLAQRAMTLELIQKFLSGATLSTLLSSIFSFLYLGLLFYYDSALALIALGIIAISAALTVAVSVYTIRNQRKAVSLSGQISGMTLQFITGINKIRAAGAENRVMSLWADVFSQQRSINYNNGSVRATFESFNAFYAVISSALIFTGVMMINREDQMDMGTFMAFWAAFGGLQGGILSLINAVSSLFQAVPYFERLRPILDEVPEDAQKTGDPGELKGGIELSGINFRYTPDGPQILKDISFKVEPGQFIAVTGPSGSGKTTLLRLLLGFETPETGSVMYDRHDLANLNISKVRKQLGVVLQGGGLMPGDILSNIVGTSDLNIKDAWEAARKAGLDRDIKEMPMGMHTVISEGSGTLSGGQKQRLIIARALARSPKILLFDEATSALDNRTQETVTRSLGELSVTRLVIAHRLSTIRDADKIIVLEDGRITQSGTYEELMKSEGIFKTLARRQET